jgi:hypothetical protein
MTPIAALLDPAENAALYVSSVLTLYLDLPDTPSRATIQDQRQARLWFERGVTLSLVETALLLAELRRTGRPRDLPPLPRIRSLAYFQPLVEELLEAPAPEGYLLYLRFKLRSIADKAEPTNVQKTTISGDR